MSLVDLWTNSKQQLSDKHIQQIVTFAGNGKLRDGNNASGEFREFLSQIPNQLLHQYIEQCLQEALTDGGLILQDLINEVGSRLGFSVEHGRYRSSVNKIGYDGLWHFPDGHDVIIEVKTTDAYRIDLERIAEYRQALIQKGTIDEKSSSILIVVGRNDTGGLEAQIRGSRYAWDMRIIGIDALARLMSLKQEVEDPYTIKQIYGILIPREYTKLDEMVDLVFSTAEDIREDQLTEQDEADTKEERDKKFIPVAFHENCMKRVDLSLGMNLLKRTRSAYSSSDDSIAVICKVSKEHTRNEQKWYWFAFHPHQRDFLINRKQGYVAFGCGTDENILLIPATGFIPLLDNMNVTERGDRYYWHVHISDDAGKYLLHLKGGMDSIILTKFLLK